LIEDLHLLTRHKLQHQGVQLVRQLTPDLPAILADATQLEQAFLNLILNAVEAMPQGGRLTIQTRKLDVAGEGGKAQHVAIEFKDTGEGMSEEQRRRAFTSLLNTTKTKGTGLGLAIVGRVVESHHGTLKIKSQPGRGTAIRVILPV
jgi:signal transduction histidine kinase